jgi:ATP-dependent protease ClpP protease subunit
VLASRFPARHTGFMETTESVSVRARRTRKTPIIDHARTVEYFGTVNYATNERVLEEIRAHVLNDATAPITLQVTSPGGPTGTAMSFYDTVRHVLKPNLTTIGSGDVDSSGIIIFLTGDTRYVTPHTTLLLHLAGRIFGEGQRFTVAEMDAMLREDRLKDFQYASVLAERSHGRLTSEQVLAMMEKNTILTPLELVTYGLADRVLS